MRRLFHAPLVLSALAVLSSLAVAADPVPPAVVVVPRPAPAPWNKLKVPAGQHVVLSAGAGTKAARWVLIDAANADLTTSGTTATFSASVPGSYRVIAFLDGSEPLLTLLVVGDGPPPPNPPDPPMPPAPDSPLRKKLKAAFDADPAAAAVKRNQAGQLAAVYKNAAAIALVSDPTSKKFAPPVGELIRRVKDAAADVTDDELVGVRKAAAEELAAIFAEDGDLTPEQRTAAAKLFTGLAAILDSF